MTPAIGDKIHREPRVGVSTDGFTLVELMVAITIGLIILAAVIRLFATSRATYTLQEGLARVQESGRFAVEFLAQDIRMAGYIGCASATTTTVQNHLNNPTDYGVNIGPDQYINGHTYTGSGTSPSALSDWTPALPGTVNGVVYFSAGDVEPNTDVLVIRRASETGIKLGAAMADTSAVLRIDANPGGLVNNDIVMVSDCTNADIFQITGPTTFGAGTNNLVHNTGAGTPGNATTPLSKVYTGDAQVMKLTTRIYYIGRRSNSTSNPPSLYRRELTTSGSLTTQELVEGVERLKFSYGEDTDATRDNTPNIYRSTSSAVLDWAKVVTVRVGALVATTSGVDQEPDTRTYSLAGNNVGPFNDAKRRRAFNSTIQLRNRL